MGVFSSGGIGIDMGSGSTAIYLENNGKHYAGCDNHHNYGP